MSCSNSAIIFCFCSASSILAYCSCLNFYVNYEICKFFDEISYILFWSYYICLFFNEHSSVFKSSISLFSRFNYILSFYSFIFYWYFIEFFIFLRILNKSFSSFVRRSNRLPFRASPPWIDWFTCPRMLDFEFYLECEEPGGRRFDFLPFMTEEPPISESDWSWSSSEQLDEDESPDPPLLRCIRGFADDSFNF